MNPDAITVDWLVEARFGLDGGAMFGIIPRPLWTRTNPADDANRIELGTRCLLIRHPWAGTILVDTGMGSKWDTKSRAIYDLRPTTGPTDAPAGLDAALAAHGLTTDQIDHVILTHLHFDHAGGVSRLAEDGQTVVATFPRARHYLMRENWSWAHAPTERDAGSYRPIDFSFFDDPNAPELVLLDGLCELFEGVTLIPRRGHTPGMACVLVKTPTDTFCHLADLIPTTGHLRIPYVMGYDLDPAQTCREKREILAEAARHGWKLVFEHDPETAWCRVEHDGRGQYQRIPEEA